MGTQTKPPIILISFLAIVCFSMVLLVACSPKPSTLLLDTTCEPPCWSQVSPGVTTKEDVFRILSSLETVEFDSINDVNVESFGTTGQIKWKFNESLGDYGGIVYLKDGIVFTIGISPKPGAFLLEDAIQLLGQPEFSYAFKEQGEVERIIIFLVYPTNGYLLLYESGRFQDNSAQIEPGHPIEFVYYFKPQQFNEIIASFLLNDQDPTVFEEKLQPWNGYGKIDYFEQ